MGIQLQLLSGAVAQLLSRVRVALAPAPACILHVLDLGHSDAEKA